MRPGDVRGGRARRVQGSRPRDAEVEHLHLARRCDLDIAGLDVTVDNAMAVRFRQRRRHPGGHFQRLLDAQAPLAENVRQGGAGYQFHGDERVAAGVLDELVDVRDVRCESEEAARASLSRLARSFASSRPLKQNLSATRRPRVRSSAS